VDGTPSRRRQDPFPARSGCVRERPAARLARYDGPVSDLLFLTLVVTFFAAAALFVAGCERIVGRGPKNER